MNLEDLRDYCLSKPHVEEGLPFGPNVLVFKVSGKMFLLTPLDTENVQFNAKCDPERAISLREEYPCVKPGYHMNKALWNTVIVDGSVSDKILREWIDHSYDLVSSKAKKKK